jgi:TolB-like protein
MGGQEMSGDAPKSGGGSPPIDPQVTVQGAKASPHVFISYASQDAAVANSIVENLEQHGLRCWLAPRDVKPGALYADAIVGAINEAKALMLVLSGSAVTSSHVSREVERAAAKRRPMIAFRIDAAPLSRALEYFLGESQWIDVRALGMPAALAKLAEAVGQGLEQTVAADPVTSAKPLKRMGGRAKLIVGASVVISVGVAVALGVRFWSQSHKAAQPAAVVAITDKSVAVLPFVDMSEKKDQEYFSDGLSEELIDMLTKVPELRVPARTSSFYFKGKQATIADIAKALGVTHVLEGSVRKSGNTLRITAQLIRVDTGYHVWSETYDRKLDDIFQIQDEIAKSVVNGLKVSVLGGTIPRATPTANHDAYMLYLQAKEMHYRGTSDNSRKAIEYLQKALELDPDFSQGWLTLASFLAADYNLFSPVSHDETRELISSALDHARKLEPSLLPIHVVMGRVLYEVDWSWQAADAEIGPAPFQWTVSNLSFRPFPIVYC